MRTTYFIKWLGRTALTVALAGTAISATAKDAPTFTKDIAPIIFNNCTACHRAGEVAPFALQGYADVKKRAMTIVEVTQKRFMPPWKAEAGFGEFHDERRLTEAQIALLKAWHEAGAPEGNPADLPASPKFPDGWMLGEPDLVLEPQQAYSLDAEGRDVYQCFVIPTQFKENRYVAAMEVRPGNRTVVHHVLAYLDLAGRARALDKETPEAGYTSFGGVGFAPAGTLGGWAPGNFPRLLPEGVGMLLPAGADVVMQVHYHKSGKAESDRTKIGLFFAKGPVSKQVRIAPVSYRQISIPPGEANYAVNASLPIPAGVKILSVMPHMHLLGKEMTVTARLPDGTMKPLVRIPDWDFNWQGSYRFKEPLALPVGSRVELAARFDNSANNPNNPSHPPQLVRRGEQTTNEMCMAFLSYTVDAEDITKGQVARSAPNKF
jgi:mono/diheme cytochrome c family protein